MTDSLLAVTEPTPLAPAKPGRRRRPRRLGWTVMATFGSLVLVIATSWTVLTFEGSGTPSPAAHGSGHDAEWLGHAWVDGRRSPADVNALVTALRTTGIRDLFV